MKARHSLLAIPCIIVALSFVATAHSQGAADPHALNLEPFGRLIDTGDASNYLHAMVPVGDIDGDGVEDLYISRNQIDDQGQQSISAYVLTKVNTKPVRIPVMIPYTPVLAADFNGDGHKDLLTIEQNQEGSFNRIHWWTDVNGPFNANFNTLLMENLQGTVYAQATGDMTGDGVTDIIARGMNKLYLYNGRPHLDSIGGFYAFDSLDLDPITLVYSLNYMTGRFTQDSKASLVFASSEWVGEVAWTAHYRVTLITMGSPDRPFSTSTFSHIHDDTLHVQDAFVYSTPSLVADISGDGLDDLVTTDSAHLYIWNGGPDFGSKTLIKANADNVIFSPLLIDPEYDHLSIVYDIGYLGDITGTGTPFFYFNTYGNMDSKGRAFTFIYAGGTATDTYFDAYLVDTVTTNAQFSTILLPDGSKGMAFAEYVLANWYINYAREGLEDIPQTKSSVARTGSIDEELHVEYVVPGSIRVSSDVRDGMLNVYDLLGRPVVTKKMDTHEALIDVSRLPAGIYYVSLEGDGIKRTGKFIR